VKQGANEIIHSPQSRLLLETQSGLTIMNPRAGLSLIICVLCVISQSRAGVIYNVGLLPGGTFTFGGGFGVSATGLNGVGSGNSSAYNGQPYYWTPSAGIHGITLPQGYTFGSLGRMSADGAFAAGYMYNSGGFDQAVRWSLAGGIQGLGYLPGQGSSVANGISVDGSVMVGYGTDILGHDQAFRWTQSGGMVGLGKLSGFANSFANNVSRDGSIVVGENYNPSNSMAFKWTQSTGMTSLGRLAGDLFSQALAVSGNGSVVVGMSATDSQHEQAFRWTAQTGMTGLGFLPGSDTSQATGITEDGTVIVGNCDVGFIWDATHGMRDLRSYLQSAGVDVSAWSDLAVGNISADGTIMSGLGYFAGGGTQGWIAVIPEPATMNLLLLGGLAGWVRRKR
jgi:probable HAF family extracellular repeat protein